MKYLITAIAALVLVGCGEPATDTGKTDVQSTSEKQEAELAAFLPGKRIYFRMPMPGDPGVPIEPAEPEPKLFSDEPEVETGKKPTPPEIVWQFQKDGTIAVGMFSDGEVEFFEGQNMSYKVNGLDMAGFEDGKEGGGMTFSSATPKKGDKVFMGEKGQEKIPVTITRIEDASSPPPVSKTPSQPPVSPAKPEPVAETSAQDIEAAIRKSLKKPTGELTNADYEKVKSLHLKDNKLTNLTGLENLTQLKTLYLSKNKLTDVTSLEKLTQLTTLYLTDNQMTDVKGLEKLTQLTFLLLDKNKLTNVKGLENLTQLKTLKLRYNQLADVTSLKKLTQLTKLDLYKNQLTVVKGLENLTELTSLNLGGNKLTDVKGLENLTQLTSLSLGNNKLADVKGLENLTQLTSLSLSQNELTDVKGLENLTQLTRLSFGSGNSLTKAQIDQLQKSLPKCSISHNAKK